VSSPGARRTLRRVSIVLACAAIAVVFGVPVYWMVITSFREPSQIFSLPVRWLPQQLGFGNYSSAWSQYDFTRFTLNSVLVSGTVTAAQVLLASLAGFGLAKYRFAGRHLLLVAILATIMLPVEVIMVPLFTTVQSLGWVNSYQGLIVPMIADAFGVFLMRQFMLRIPDDLIHSARLDGASEIRIFLEIAMPLSWPAVATLAIFVWRETWDDFLWPFLIISDTAHRTLPLGIALMQQDFLTDYGRIMALATLATIPPALIFFLFQRTFMRGIALTGLRA
jgi:ABC-type glycerol-3-phosphate transport system permease component